MTTDEIAAESTSTRTTTRWSLSDGPRLMALGMLLLQLTWVFCVPPFMASDEFDHVYKAAAVARGDWIPEPSSATRGTGAWLEVPADLPRAARAQCQFLKYTGDEDCVGTPHGDEVRIASGAGRYHPLYYAIVGTPALPFSGYTALYVMRLATVLISWLLFCAAIFAVRSWARSAWPTALLAVACTPVLVFSASVVAPNGVEMMAALAFWCSLFALVRRTGPPRTDLLAIAAVSGSVLATVRSLGPLWCLLAMVTVFIATPDRWTRLRLFARSRAAWVAAAVLFLVALQSAIWIRAMGSLDIGERAEQPLDLTERIGKAAGQLLLWVFQSIAAFPHRDEHTNPFVYVCFLTLFIAALVYAVRAAQRPVRAGLWSAIALSIVVPAAIVTATWNRHESVWQGRYGLPYAVGMMIVAGVALDGSTRHRLHGRVRTVGLLLFVVAQTVSAVWTMQWGLDHRLSDASHWVHPHQAVAAVLAAVGSAALWWGASRAPSRSSA